MHVSSKIIKCLVKLRSLLSSFLEGVRIFILTTFFRHKAEGLEKKSKFETTGSNPGGAVQEEKLKTELEKETDKFEELLAALTKTESTKEKGSIDMFQSIFDTASYGQGMIENSYPTYILDIEEDTKWLYSVQRKTYVPVKAGTEVIPVTTEEGQEEYFCVINNELFSLEEDLVTCIGWN